jgi:hypothetical protein
MARARRKAASVAEPVAVVEDAAAMDALTEDALDEYEVAPAEPAEESVEDSDTDGVLRDALSSLSDSDRTNLLAQAWRRWRVVYRLAGDAVVLVAPCGAVWAAEGEAQAVGMAHIDGCAVCSRTPEGMTVCRVEAE